MKLENPFSYLESGSRDNPSILFLHGFLGNKEDWKEVIDQIDGQFHCIAVDLPGHGETSFPRKTGVFGIPECANEILSFLESLEIDSTRLIGYSMGGRLALYLGLHYPEKIKSLILESSSPGLTSERERIKRRNHDENLAEQLRSEPLEVFLMKWYKQAIFENLSQTPLLLKVLMEKRCKNNRKELACSLKQMGVGVQPNLWSLLGQGRIPIKLVVGEKDSKFLRIAKKIMEIYPLSSLSVIKNCGHNIHFEAPNCFVREISSFFGD